MTPRQEIKLCKQKAQEACRENGIKVFQKNMTILEKGLERTKLEFCGMTITEVTYVMFRDEASGKEYQCYYGAEYYNVETKSLWAVNLYNDGSVKFKAEVADVEKDEEVAEDEEIMCYRVYEKSCGLIGTFFNHMQALSYVNASGFSICDCEIVKEPYEVKEEPTKVETDSVYGEMNNPVAEETTDPMEEKLTVALQKLEFLYADYYEMYKKYKSGNVEEWFEDGFSKFKDLLDIMTDYEMITHDMHDHFEHEARMLLDYYHQEISRLNEPTVHDAWAEVFLDKVGYMVNQADVRRILVDVMLDVYMQEYDDTLSFSITDRLQEEYRAYVKEHCNG